MLDQADAYIAVGFSASSGIGIQCSQRFPRCILSVPGWVWGWNGLTGCIRMPRSVLTHQSDHFGQRPSRMTECDLAFLFGTKLMTFGTQLFGKHLQHLEHSFRNWPKDFLGDGARQGNSGEKPNQWFCFLRRTRISFFLSDLQNMFSKSSSEYTLTFLSLPLMLC